MIYFYSSSYELRATGHLDLAPSFSWEGGSRLSGDLFVCLLSASIGSDLVESTYKEDSEHSEVFLPLLGSTDDVKGFSAFQTIIPLRMLVPLPSPELDTLSSDNLR